MAGEASGDLHGCHLMSAISQRSNSIFFRGVGGPLMKGCGLQSVGDFNRLSVMGFFEVLKDLPFIVQTKHLLIKDIKKHAPQKIILIDYPGFNLSLAKAIKSLFNIPIVFYISPQVWAWKESRIKIINNYVDQMVVVFPFEVDWYSKKNMSVNYFGHPLVDIYKGPKKTVANNKSLTIGLFPGSRPQEIEKHLPVLKDVVLNLKSRFQKIKFVLGVVDNSCSSLFQQLGLEKGECEAVVNDSFSAFDKSDFAVVASGTATLECAITKTPFIVIYKTSYINWVITSMYLKIGFVSIVNILAGKHLVVECLQKNCTSGFIIKHLMQLITTKQDDLVFQLDRLVRSLGEGRSYNKTAKFILNQ